MPEASISAQPPVSGDRSAAELSQHSRDSFVNLGGVIPAEFNNADLLNNALRAVVKEIQDQHPNRPISVNVSIKQGMRCDLTLVQQLVFSLLSNALTHGTAGRLISFNSAVQADFLILRVWNEGPPVPPDALSRIFSPHDPAAAHREGLRLGLQMCLHIARAHKGTLTVSSTERNGTQFTARLSRMC